MTELVFVVCLAAAPATCEEQSLRYVEASQRACLIQAPPRLARWSLDHPGWNVHSWTCRVAGESFDI